MFVLVILEDKIKIDPEQFEQDPTEALIQQIELKFANKVDLWLLKIEYKMNLTYRFSWMLDSVYAFMTL